MKPLDTPEPTWATAAELESARLPADFARLAVAIVAATLRASFADEAGVCTPDGAVASLRPSHRRWLETTLRLLEHQGLVVAGPGAPRRRFAAIESADALWKQWEAARAGDGARDDHRAYLVLIEACLRHLPEILTGVLPATDVMFPGSSMHLVEGVYRQNRIADHFNAVLVETLRAELAARSTRGERGVRLLEIGAGTGGTTTALLPMLRGFGDLIAEYCYTDLSRAFLLHAEEAYKPQLPALRTAIFDVAKPLAAQSVEGDHYDAVIATNVLHATPSIRETLRNSKAALKRGGVLLVNEISEWSWHTHFTFGLLDGWWLYEDEALRLPGSPGLSPAQWERVLEAERFFDIRFPAREQHGLGQQIIAARSDGVVRQRLSGRTATTVPPPTAPIAANPVRPSSRVAPPAAPRSPAANATHAASAVASDERALREAGTALFRETIAGALRMEAREIEAHKPLSHYGLDSILVVQLTTRFRKLFPGVRSTLFFEVQSIDGLVEHFIANDRATLSSVLAARAGDHPAADVLAQPVSAPASTAGATTKPAPRRRLAARPAHASAPTPETLDPTRQVEPRLRVEDVAIIGLSGRYPQAPDLERFWENLSSGRDCITEIPAERWRWQDHYHPEKSRPGKSYTKWGGFLADVDKFDPLFFKIAPKEAKRMDPQERLFLETSYEAIEDSGYTPGTLAAAGRVGVFVGVMNSRYTVQPLYYSIANRVSFLFDFSGPSFAIDSACSSSLTAIHVALDSLRCGLCEVAIAGGVSLILDPQHMLELTAVGMLSEGPFCRSFGRNADGFVDAEGVGAVVLKPLAQAVRDRDNIQAVIRGSALNAGGRTHGYTVPNPAAQAHVVSVALERAQVDSAEVGFVEAHGTGTALGDPIEIAGLAKAFRASRRAPADAGPTQHCAIGSVKSNIGHCESAAGIAALTKVVLQLKHGQLVPTLHAGVVNDEIDFAATPFRLQRELAPWSRMTLGEGSGTREVPRIAGISSFGAGGANAHLVVQEAPRVDDAAAHGSNAAAACIVPLSARKPEQLEEKIRRLLAFLERKGGDIGLQDLAYTLQVGREPMDERLALVVDSIDDLRRQLRALVNGDRLDPAPPRGNTRAHKDHAAACDADPGLADRCAGWLARREHVRLAEHWVKGVDVDWLRLYEGWPRRISLPTYPFARERHWIEPQRSAGRAPVSATAHPLLQRNRSTLRYPEYGIALRGDERFLDEDAGGRRRLSLYMCAEMARAAVAATYPESLAAREVCLEDVVGDALGIDGACDLHIAVLPDGEDDARFEIFSTRDGVERVQCQGLARLVPADAPAPVDVARFAAPLARGVSGETFHSHIASLGLAVPADRVVVRRAARTDREVVLEYAVEDASGPAWGVRPEILGVIEPGIAWWLAAAGATSSRPFEWRTEEAATVRLHAASDRHGYLVVRCTGIEGDDPGRSEWAVELYDPGGRACLRAEGLRLGRRVDRRPGFPGGLASAAEPGPRARVDKPMAVRLSGVDSVDEDPAMGRIERPPVTLLPPGAEAVVTAEPDAPSSPRVELCERGPGVYAITFRHPVLDRGTVEDLRGALERVQQRPDVRVVLIEGAASAFLHGDRAALVNAIHSGLYRTLVEFPVPTIAALCGGAGGAGFLLAALCDFMVCGRESRYAFSDPQNGIRPTPAESDLLAARFGEAWASDLLFISGPQLGGEMEAKGWTFRVAEEAQVMPTGLALAQDIAGKPRDALRLLKQHMAAGVRAHVARLGEARPPEGTDGEGEDVAVRQGAHVLPDAREGVVVEWLSDRVASIRLRDGGDGAAAAAQLRNLGASLDEVVLSGATAVLLRSEHRTFLPQVDAAHEPELLRVRDALARHPVPVIAALEQGADGAGWLLALWSDACVYARQGRYSSEGLWRHPSLLRLVAPLLRHRVGADAAKRLLLGAEAATGAELARGACVVADGGPDGVLAAALTLAESTPLRSAPLLRQWRSRQPSRRVDDDVALGQGPVAGNGEARGRAAGVPMPSSPVVATEVRDNGVVVVRMVERGARNMFSPELIRGLEDVFAHIDSCDDYRAVVLCGYDTYFACGGTQESLLAIQQGKARFTDTRLYQLPMNCRIPVIAAMQGHAIGGGWSLGMFADIRLFSAESRYVSPYMQYGFTPGAGSTLIFPATLGIDLARETLFAPAEHTGAALAARGLRDTCLARSEVLARALALADAVAARPAEDVVALKRYLNAPTLAAIEETYARELAMHEQTFVANAQVLESVLARFLDDHVSAPPVWAEARETGDVAAELRSLLAAELQMRVEDVGEDTPFVDLGLDSITGVTWVRKINERYGLRIEATRVYSHPNLRQFGELVRSQVATSTTDHAGPVDPQVNVTVEPESDVRAELKRMLAEELHLAAADIDEHRPFVDLGLDSITGVTWVRRINERYGIRIEATRVYSRPTLAEFGALVIASMPARSDVPSRTGPSTDRAPVTPSLRAAEEGRDEAKRVPRLRSWRKHAPGRRASLGRGGDVIAVIGMAGQFPRARNLDELWRNIAAGRECIDMVPPQRWDVERYFNEDVSVPGTTNSRWMGVLDDCDAFDPLFFNISPTEAEIMDPQQRLMLQSCWHAIEDAAIDPRALSGSRCGVFIGCGATDYHQRSREHQLSTQAFTGASMSILAARISYFLNLQGPCLSIDTACSSSLVAIASACDSLVAGNCDVALAGGVAVMAGPMMHVKTGQSGMLSVDGRCFAFDHRANGFVPSEGVGTVMLKRLADARRDGDIVHATIRGWGINQDGKTNGITAPNPVSQARLMRDVYDKFGIDPEDIQMVEAHGTGTKLGDPIEVEGLVQAFRHYTPKTRYCALGSVKGNVGHCLYAAGIAGVMKLVLAMRHRQLPPAASFERLNPHIDLADTPFVIETELRPWPVNPNGNRMAVVSSFGFSGTNAHLVLESAAEVEMETLPAEGSPRPALIPLSARSPEQLRQRAQDLAAILATEPGASTAAPALPDIAYTLQVGREAMEERCALVARSVRDLVERLGAFAAGQQPKGVHVGNVHGPSRKLSLLGQDGDLQDALVETCLRDGKLETLAELWVGGFGVPWERLHRDAGPTGRQPRRIALPLYPFAKERYWLDDDSSRKIETAEASSPVHPLLHANISTLAQQRYRTTLRGDEAFLRDHRVRVGGRIEKVLPGVAYLEMAVAALADAWPEPLPSQRVVLSDVAWWRPLVVTGPMAVEIELGVHTGGALRFEISSGRGEDRIVYCQGEAGYVAADARRPDPTALAFAAGSDRWSAGDIYAAFERVGLLYGPAHRGLHTLARVGRKVAARVLRPAGLDAEGLYRLHLGVMDAALQACIGFLPSLGALPEKPAVPFALTSLTIHAPCPPEVDVVLTASGGATNGAPVESCDVSIHGPDGALCVEMRGFRWRALDGHHAASRETWPVAEAGSGPLVEDEVFDAAFHQELLDSVARNELSAEDAVELGFPS